MAMFHLSTKTISRKTGRTATASAAYRAGEKIECQRTGLVHDYTRKSGVMASSAFLYDGDNKIELNRQDLWNTAEKSEKRKDARTAREIVVNLPHELSADQRQHLVDDFTKSLAKGLGVAIDYAIHEPNRKGDDRNYHAHILMTTRQATLENGVLVLGNKSNLELENKALKSKGLISTQEQITSIRKDWADYTNHHLAKAGLDISIDHRSHAARGLIKAPTIKLGVAVTAMERRGIQTEKGDINRAIRQGNDEIYELCEQQWAEEHPYYIAPEPPAPKPAPKPAPAPEPEPEPAPEPPAPPRPSLAALASYEYTADDAVAEIFAPRVDGNSAERTRVHEVVKRGIYEQYNRKGYNHEYDDARMKKINEIADAGVDVAMKTKTTNPYERTLRLDAINILKEKMEIPRVEYDIPKPAPTAPARARDDDFDLEM